MSLAWKIRRLKAMGPAEVAWRLSQKRSISAERRVFAEKSPVCDVVDFGGPRSADLSVLGLNFHNRDYTVGGNIDLLGDYCYCDYKTRWHAAFRADSDWPMRFSQDYSFGAEDVPGDIRTNWELNRCRQFALLAKSYRITGDGRYLAELEDLFNGWNEANPFMWGPEWSSPMESSIRLVNWLFAAAFLEGLEGADRVSDMLVRGSYVMAAHVRRHYSRFSSANNHTIVEAAGVAIAALVFGEGGWIVEALDILGDELRAQTHSDGVNMEQALHYQLFSMEAVCLVLHALRASGHAVPDGWVALLSNMARYVVDCRAGEEIYVEFGDDDEGVILCLEASKPCYADCVLSLCTMELVGHEKLTFDVAKSETVRWLYSVADLAAANRRPVAEPRCFATYPDGGVTLMRSENRRMVVAFDHGPLGLGALAAHGHADALSVQLFVDGSPLIADPGTFVYNADSGARVRYRSTATHSTVCLGGRDQSEQLGPFLWGRKAAAGLALSDEVSATVTASHDGYAPATHSRTVQLDGALLKVEDCLNGRDPCETSANFLLVGCEANRLSAKRVELLRRDGLRIEVSCEGGKINVEPASWSPRYLVEEPALRLRVVPEGPEWATIFSIGSVIS